MNQKTRFALGLTSLLAVLLVAACVNDDRAEAGEAKGNGSESVSLSIAASGACQPLAELSALDDRTPVVLQPMMAWHQKQNMMKHLVAIQRITGALVTQDWDEIDSAATLIESSAQMQQMCEHMGAATEGFTDVALDFHRRADEIGVAARAKDSAAVLRATSNTLQACTGCHATYRQEVVDATTWEQRARKLQGE